MRVSNLGNRLKVWHVVFWVANTLNVDSLGVLINCGRKILGVVSIDELGVYAQPWQEDLQLIVGSSV